MDNSLPGDRAIVKRLPQRAAYDRATIDRILDEGLICHVGFIVDNVQTAEAVLACGPLDWELDLFRTISGPGLLLGGCSPALAAAV